MLQTRFHQLSDTNPAHRLHLRPGTIADYHALARHHYRNAKPATVTRVLTLDDPQPAAVGRFTGKPGGPRVVAVLVESMPVLNCAMRDAALPGRFGSWLPPRERAALLNAEVRCVSRVVVAPAWRGLGLSTRLVSEALATATTPITEALAAMGHICPFFERAGMVAYRRPPHQRNQRLLDALASAGVTLEVTPAQLDALPPASRRLIEHELARWSRAQRRRDVSAGPLDQLALARTRLRFAPVYYAALHPTGTPS